MPEIIKDGMIIRWTESSNIVIIDQEGNLVDKTKYSHSRLEKLLNFDKKNEGIGYKKIVFNTVAIKDFDLTNDTRFECVGIDDEIFFEVGSKNGAIITGTKYQKRVDVSLKHPIRAGCRYMMLSDGSLEFLEEVQIGNLWKRYPDPVITVIEY